MLQSMLTKFKMPFFKDEEDLEAYFLLREGCQNAEVDGVRTHGRRDLAIY